MPGYETQVKIIPEKGEEVNGLTGRSFRNWAMCDVNMPHYALGWARFVGR